MKILYGVVGEGMGHAMRSRVILEHLVAQGHELEIMVSGKAHDYLAKRFEGVNRIAGLHMIFEEQRIRKGKTLWSNVLGGLTGLPHNIAAYFELVDTFTPEVVISDFESWAYLYGKAHRLPILSVDNMQLIHRATLPQAIIDEHRVAFEVTKAFVKSKLPGCDAYFVSTFCDLPIRKPDTKLFPPILRPEILAATPRTGDHLLVYQTGSGNENLYAALRQTGLPCRIYGGVETERHEGLLHFRTFSETTFIDDLASCKGVLAGGGFTLMGEAVYLHKPMLAVPLEGQFEQVLNAKLLERMGYGMAAEAISPEAIQQFLRQLPHFEANLAEYKQRNNADVLAAIDGFLAHTADK